jgi:hypothetical protein
MLYAEKQFNSKKTVIFTGADLGSWSSLSQIDASNAQRKAETKERRQRIKRKESCLVGALGCLQ